MAVEEHSFSPTALAIGICTYKRHHSLVRLLEHIAVGIEAFDLAPTIIVIDNDGQDPEVAKSVLSLADRLKLTICYSIESQPGISAARNAVFKEADRLKVGLLAMIDDDEWPSPQWLSELLKIKRETDAVVVGGPVSPVFPETARALEKYARYWSVERQFIQGKPFVFCTCNFLIDLPAISSVERPLFDEEFGLSGGGDTVFFRRLFFHGHKMAWAERAVVFEEVSEARATVPWIRQRRFRVGNHAVRWESLGKHSLRTLLKSFGLAVRLIIYPLLQREPESPLFGWLLEFEKVRGRFAAHFGRMFIEYGREAKSGDRVCRT